MQEQIQQRIEQAIQEKVFPGAVVGVVNTNGTKLIVPAGHFTYDASPQVTTDTVYDVASVTKAIPTACIALTLVEKGMLSLEDPITKYLPDYANNYSEQVRIKHLLTYGIVLDFKSNTPAPEGETDTARRNRLREQLKHLTPAEIKHNLLTTDLTFSPGERMEYSNAPAMLLAMVSTAITGKSIDMLGAEYFFEPLGMKSATFTPTRPEHIPPTEIEEWRGLVQGVVHDETSYILSQEAPSGAAGLFTNVPDILVFLEMLLNKGALAGRRYFSPEMVTQMHKDQIHLPESVMGLGFELAEPRFMGKMSRNTTFGKCGFTGTSIVVDPERNVAVTLLSNRIYPKRSSPEAINVVRQDIADIVFSNL